MGFLSEKFNCNSNYVLNTGRHCSGDNGSEKIVKITFSSGASIIVEGNKH